MKKIVFGITGLNLGGAERVLVDLSNKLVEKYDITIFTLYGNGEFEKQLDKRVKLVSVYDRKYEEINKVTKLKTSFQLFNYNLRNMLYKKYIKGKYDVEIAFLEGPITWIFSCPGNARKIAWVHNDIEDVFGSGEKAKAKQELNKEAYLKYDELIFVSQDNLNKFQRYFKGNKVMKRVIYNYLDCDLVLQKAMDGEAPEIKDDMISFVQVSRLVEQKAVGRLVEVHKKLIDDGFMHRIYIVGDGPLKEELQNKIKELGVEETFVLLGKRENPYPYIKAADYFLLASYYEGYGMVLVEAKTLNKYIIITDSAAREALLEYDNKLILKNDDKGIYDGLKNVIKKQPKAKVTKKDTFKKILDEVSKLIEGE